MANDYRLKELRKRSKLSQEKLANLLGITVPTYSRHENGFFKLDSSMLCKLAEYYNVSADYILRRTNDPRMYKKESDEYTQFAIKYHNLNDLGREIVAAVLQTIEQKEI